MMLLGMTYTVSAQSVRELRELREKQRVEKSLSRACEDDDQYMAELGKATWSTANGAETRALQNAQQRLKMRLEQTVKAVIEDLSHSSDLETADAWDAVTIRKVNTGFQSVINKSIGHTTKCYSDSWQNDKGQWEAEYNCKIAIEEFIKSAEAAISNDAVMRANVGIDQFEGSFREHLKDN